MSPLVLAAVSWIARVLLFDYRGCNYNSGQPSEPSLCRGTGTAWVCLVDRPETAGTLHIIFGQSLGGAVTVEPATRVASTLPTALLLLQNIVHRGFQIRHHGTV